jgi:hypothetical protein
MGKLIGCYRDLLLYTVLVLDCTRNACITTTHNETGWNKYT